MDPRKAIAAVVTTVLLGSAALLPGCMLPGFNVTNPIPYESGVIPTERQLQIARDLGVSEKVIEEKYLVEGLDSESFDRIMHAEHMLDHLEEKYGEIFKPNWIIREQHYEMEVTVASGEFEEATCEIRYYWKDLDEPYYADNYYPILKQYEYKSYLTELVEEVYGESREDTYALDAGLGTAVLLDDEIGPNTDVRRPGLRLAGHVYIYFPPTCELTKDEYDALHEEFLDLFAEKGIEVSYRIMVITKLLEKDEGKPFTPNIAWAANRASTDEDPTFKWEILSHISTERDIKE